jgi:HSP20 family protein
MSLGGSALPRKPDGGGKRGSRTERFQGRDSCAILCAMAGWPSVLMTPEFGDLTDDVRRLFRELDQQGGTGAPVIAGQCAPVLDVLETDDAIEIVVDLPGVPRDAVRVLLKGDVVVVAGQKIPLSPGGPGDYHLVERGSGRFARAVRVASPFDGAGAAASLINGELRIMLPRIHDRRGAARSVTIGTEALTRDC